MFAVQSHAKKEGLSLNARDVKETVEEVMKFLFMAQADNRGGFKEISKSKDKKSLSSSVPPSYYSEMNSYFENNSSESVIIVSISNINLSEVYKCDLMVTSRDLNYSDFSLQLANCLNLPSSTIAMECSNLNKRGLMRLLAFMKKMKLLFDSRVRVILISATELPVEVDEFCAIDFSSSESPCKKAKLNLPSKVNEDENSKSYKIKSFAENDSRSSENRYLIEEMKTLKCNKDSLELNHNRLQVEYDKMKLTQEILTAERDHLKVENKDVMDERDILEAENDGLKLVNKSFKENIRGLQMENKKLQEERNNYKIDKEALEIIRDDMKEERDKLKVDNSCMNVERETVLVNLENIRAERDRLIEERNLLKGDIDRRRDCLEKEQTALVQERDDLLKERDCLKERSDNLEENNLSKIMPSNSGRNVSYNPSLQVESLKNVINGNKISMPKANAPELVQKSIPKLHIKPTVEGGGEDSWTFTASILKPEFLNNEVKLRVFVGNGSSKKMAKTRAFENLIASIMSFETD